MITKLTKEQKNMIDSNYLQIPDVDQLTKIIFENEELDGRNKEGKLVAEYMIERGYGYKTRVHKKAKKIKLSENQENLIKEYARDKLNSLQIAQLIFQDREVKNLSMEQRVVADFLKINYPEFIKPTDTKKNEYTPPTSTKEVLNMINEYAHEEIEMDKLKRFEKDCLGTTKKYISSPRFVQLMNTYNCDDSQLFKAEYIRAVWDKPDLTADEINLYINVCVDYVNLKTIQKNMEKINQMFDEVEDQTEMSVKLAEILKAKSAEYHQCEQRQESLIKKLNGDRSVRMKNKQDRFGSILNLVQSFQEEEERNRMIQIAEMQKQLVEDEVDRLEDMEAWKSRVLGLRKGDVL